MGAEDTMRVDPEAMQRAATALSCNAADLQNRLAALDRQVGEMLGGWRGASGGAYAAAWELWRRGAAEVQLGLSALAHSVDEAGAGYRRNDARASQAARALRSVRDG
jgi:WXG100 family type VII secretion target